jgi:hypothetical protein
MVPQREIANESKGTLTNTEANYSAISRNAIAG